MFWNEPCCQESNVEFTAARGIRLLIARFHPVGFALLTTPCPLCESETENNMLPIDVHVDARRAYHVSSKQEPKRVALNICYDSEIKPETCFLCCTNDGSRPHIRPTYISALRNTSERPIFSFNTAKNASWVSLVRPKSQLNGHKANRGRAQTTSWLPARLSFTQTLALWRETAWRTALLVPLARTPWPRPSPADETLGGTRLLEAVETGGAEPCPAATAA